MNIELFGEAGNFAIVQLPGRKSPGVVFQLDSLERITADLENALRMSREGLSIDAASELGAICSELREISAVVARILSQRR